MPLLLQTPSNGFILAIIVMGLMSAVLIYSLAGFAAWGMAFFAVIFSLYLTYLEPFIIRAVCIWCLSSAVIVTLLLLLGTPPAIRQFSSLKMNAASE